MRWMDGWMYELSVFGWCIASIWRLLCMDGSALLVFVFLVAVLGEREA